LASEPVEGHRVKRPERQIDTVELAAYASFTKLIGSKPAGLHPLPHVFLCDVLVDQERQHSIDGNAIRRVMHMFALQWRAATGALGTGQSTSKCDGRSA